MKTIKIIDLLYKIHTGEKPIKKIKYKDKIFNYERYVVGEGDSYFDAEWKEVEGYRAEVNGTFYYLCADTSNLEDEVEIIEEEPRNIEVCGSWFTKTEYDRLAHPEEDNKIEKLIPTSLKGIDNLDEKIEVSHIDTMSVIDKINEIIDVINKMNGGKE